jgi:hypothetical protein
MSLFGSSRAPRSVAQVMVRELHVSVLQVCAYVGLFVVMGLGVLEVMSSPQLERAAEKLLVPAERPEWMATSTAPLPMLRGRQ